MRVRSIEAGSKYTGRLPKGCVLCRRGAKMVLLVTGICETGCFYCPLSRKKKGRGVVYADEQKVGSDEDVLTEARSINAKGTGITGGDPLLVLGLTLKYVSLLKSSFGEKHHIHLYTSSIDQDAYRSLEAAGLDELRIHPPIQTWRKLERTELRKVVAGSSMKIGMEVPAIPDRREDLVALVNHADSIGMDFVNITELEFSETNWKRLRARGFDVKNDVSS
ncbi:MAG: radical SAM protein, partial [Methanomassiliicoccales archaeon]|nr:radical SAM protein [Methanomassiliicoccales archaeon]